MLVTGKKTLQGKFNGAITEIGKSPKSFSRVDGKYLQYSSNVGLARAYPCSMELAINQLKICNLLASRPDLVCMITIGERVNGAALADFAQEPQFLFPLLKYFRPQLYHKNFRWGCN